MRVTFTNAFLGISAVALLSCAQPSSVTEQPASQPLETMERTPVPEKGTRYIGIRNGDKTTTVVTESNSEIITWRRDDGCTWSIENDAGWNFAPEVEWSNCGTSGSMTVDGMEGDIWPLRVGNTWSYTATGRTEGASYGPWDGSRRCRVEAATRIETNLGEHDVYKVVCRSKWRLMTWYVSPELEEEIKYTQRPLRGSDASTVDWELVRIESPS